MAGLNWLVGIPAFFILLTGVLALLGKGVLGGYARAITGIIPFGNAKIWAIGFIALGLIYGGVAGAGLLWGKVANSMTTATVIDTQAQTNPPVQLGACTRSTVSATTAVANGNITFRRDPQDVTHEFIDVRETNGNAIINGTLSCERLNSADLSKGGALKCNVAASSYKSETSTTDSNVYYILALSTTASKVTGYPWQQTAYLNDGAVATTTSSQEETDLVFAQDVARRTLGFYMEMPGNTNWGYLNNQSSKDIDIVCGGKKAFRFTLTKVAGTA